MQKFNLINLTLGVNQTKTTTQPNMRLLYNLLGWEVKLAQERAKGDRERLHEGLARCLNWPYLAKEVHALNEKYLRPPN